MKVLNIADIHFGNSNNSVSHNEAMLDFFVWLIEYKEENYPDAELNILGDVFHQRDKLSVDTINYAIRGINMLSEHFDKVRIIVGNHDMFQRDSLEVNSINIFGHTPNVTIVDDIIIEGDIMYTPWIVTQEDYANVIDLSKEKKIKHIFGHFEFSTFRLNDNYVMEYGMSHSSLKHVDTVVTGHYHGRQEVDNIVYVGNPFPYDFNDANDENKGFMIFDTETGDYSFENYGQISVTSVGYKELMEIDWENVDQDFSNDSLRVVIEDDVSEEELDNIKNILETNNFRTSKLVYKRSMVKRAVEEDTSVIDTDEIMTVDETVIHHIKNIEESDTLNKPLLLELYEDILK